MSDDLRNLLDQFVTRFTGVSIHTEDEGRWADFVIAAHRANTDVTDDEKELYEAFEVIRDDTWQDQRVREYHWGRILLARNAVS